MVSHTTNDGPFATSTNLTIYWYVECLLLIIERIYQSKLLSNHVQLSKLEIQESEAKTRKETR